MKTLNFRFIFIIFLGFIYIPAASSQTALPTGRVNLEDVKIKGEANGNGLGFANRSRYSLSDRIKIRENFRPEIEENIPVYFSNSFAQKSYP